MSGQYEYTSLIWPSFLTVLLLIILSVYSGRRRSVPGASPFTIACLCAALWAAGSMMEYAALNLATKIAWVKFQSAWHVPIVTAVTCFILEYTWPGRWLTRRVSALLSVAPLLTVVLMLTNNLHHLAWRRVEFDGSSIQLIFGPAGWLVVAYAIGMLGIVSLIAFDLAGNFASLECGYNVIYDFGGYYPPVEPAPTFNLAEPVSAIPLKFSLAGDQGLDILADGFPTMQEVVCDTLEPIGDPFATRPAGNSGLSYDPLTGWYIYVWKTGKNLAGICQVITVQLIDSTGHLAYFRFE